MPFIKLYSLEEDGNTVGVDANSSRGRQHSQRLLYLAVRRYETRLGRADCRNVLDLE